MESRKDGKFARATLLCGEDVMENVSKAKIILFGVGGVGGWCAEALVRSGVRHLTIVDADCVAESNINRQIMATTLTVGRPKVEVLRQRLLEINPEAEITALQKLYCEENADEFRLDDYDYVIDAIDSLKDKISLILRASERKGRLFSSMGAALKMDPTRVKTGEFWEVQGCPLAATIRRKMRRTKRFPANRFTCVYDDELLPNRGDSEKNDGDGIQDGPIRKACINGSAVSVTAIFGMTLSGLIINDIYKKTLMRK